MSRPDDSAAFDVVVLGAGPAGVGAASAATAAGARVLVIDEASEAGGQVYRAPRPGWGHRGKAGGDIAEGERQRTLLKLSGAQCLFGHRVWMVGRGFRIDTLGRDGASYREARALVVATGTTERVVPFPGWTLPGVTGLAAATILLKAQDMLPGRRVIVAGSGPLLAAVAHGIVTGGGEVAAVVDRAPRRRWLAALRGMAGNPSLAFRGANWVARLALARTRHLPEARIVRVEAYGESLVATIGAVAGASPKTSCRIEADAVVVGDGLLPATEVTRLLRAEHVWRPALGGWVARRDTHFRTTIPGLYVAGDGAGIRGAAAAHLQGQVAGGAAAAEARGAAPPETADLRRRLARAERFGAAAAAMMAPDPGAYDDLPAETIVCRCEDVTAGEIEGAIEAGARDVNQLKHWTRCGMGPCQGRFCGETAGFQLARAVGGREAAGLWTGRAPLRPVAVADLAGRFSYDDIPIPPPAPL